MVLIMGRGKKCEDIFKSNACKRTSIREGAPNNQVVKMAWLTDFSQPLYLDTIVQWVHK